MKPEIKAMWVEALRSGEYKQGRERLSDGETYCCLGVLCELAANEGVVTSRDHDACHDWCCTHSVFYDGSGFFLPDSVMEWSGMPNDRGQFGNHSNKSLAYLNDEKEYNFSEIAKVIEEKF